MNEQTQNFLENEAQRLRKSIRNMEDTLERREADDVDESQLEGMHKLLDNERVQLEYIEFLQERTDTLQDVLDITRIYLNLANDTHAEIDRPENTQAWHETLNDKHFLTALVDRVHLELDYVSPPETENSASFDDSSDDFQPSRTNKPF